MMCPMETCVGLVHVAWEASPPQPSRRDCRKCGTSVCARRTCGVPWTKGHRCADIIEAQRQAAEQRAAAEAAEVVDAFGGSVNRTRLQVEAAPRFRPCPTCGVMVEHDGGCNIMYHSTCGTSWCFVCQRVGTCGHFHCKAPAKKQDSETPASADVSVQAKAAAAVHVDHSKPVVKIRVCFDDGRRELCLNDDHTVGDLRHLCSVGAEPAGGVELKARFPGALPLTDDSISVRAAGLLNTVVIARPLRI